MGLNVIAQHGSATFKANSLQGHGTRVAILDAWPVDRQTGDETGEIQRCIDELKRDGLDTSRHVRLLTKTAGNRLTSSSRVGHFTDYVRNSVLAGMCPRRPDCGGMLEPEYIAADHGLFVADLVDQIAPGTELQIYRVLNDYGLGELFTTALAVQQAIYDRDTDPTAGPDTPLVINLSLGFGPELPALDDLLHDPLWAYTRGDNWGGHVRRQIAAWSTMLTAPMVPGTAAVARLLDARDDLSMLVLQKLFSVASAGNIIAVAAAGNDSCRRLQQIAPPRFPAIVEGAIGVSAAGGRGMTDYSNLDDEDGARDNGVTAFGGDCDYGRYPVCSGDDALVGLYVTGDLTQKNGTTRASGAWNYGRARWSGTSFATPIVSGLAACIWSEAAFWSRRHGCLAYGIPAVANPSAPDPPGFMPANDLLTALVKPGTIEKSRIGLRQHL